MQDSESDATNLNPLCHHPSHPRGYQPQRSLLRPSKALPMVSVHSALGHQRPCTSEGDTLSQELGQHGGVRQ